MSDYVEFDQLRHAGAFRADAAPILRATLSGFLGCTVSIHYRPAALLKQSFQIDIDERPRRGCYIIDDSKAVLLGRILREDTRLSAFAVILEGAGFHRISRLLNVIEAALTLTASRSYMCAFDDAPQRFGDALVELCVAKAFSKGTFDYRRFLQLIDVFRKLASTDFEGRNFTTGLILTRSHYAYADGETGARAGTRYQLATRRTVGSASGVDKRFWYLADGHTSFFLCEPKLRVSSLFLLSGEGPDLAFTDAYTLSKTVRGSDALFRVLSRAEFSVTSSHGLEYLYKENTWRLRDLGRFVELVRSLPGSSELFADRLLWYVATLSKRRQSALLWVPSDEAAEKRPLLSENRLSEEPLSIVVAAHAPVVLRMMSSDGATVLSTSGAVERFGCIVDSSRIQVSGVKGTGESIAAYLGRAGLAIKVSQDGTIKVFSNRLPSVLYM